MTTLVIADYAQEFASEATARAISAAQGLGGGVDVLVLGASVCEASAHAAALSGVSKVLTCEDPALAHGLAEPMAEAIVAVGGGYDILLFAATAWGRSVSPRVAALLDIMPVSDLVEILDFETFVRPIYAGNALETLKCRQEKKILTIRPSAFSAVAVSGEKAPVEKVFIEISKACSSLSSFEGAEIPERERPELSSARVVISGGRGMKSGENFQMLERIADLLGGALGASRAAVDAGFVPNDYQVGQTGKIVAPELYIAVGISGAIQHVAGMKDSKVIVAINKDEQAPIFQVADYGLVGDLFEILPEFEEKIKRLGVL